MSAKILYFLNIYVALFHMLFVKFIFEQFLIHGITIFNMIVANNTS